MNKTGATIGTHAISRACFKSILATLRSLRPSDWLTADSIIHPSHFELRLGKYPKNKTEALLRLSEFARAFLLRGNMLKTDPDDPVDLLAIRYLADSNVEQETLRDLQSLLNAPQEGYRHFANDDPMAI